MLYQHLLRLYQRFYNRRNGRRNLCFLFFILVILGILFHVAFIFRRNYVRSYDTNAWFDHHTEACEGHFVGYGHQFVWLKKAQVDMTNEVFTIPCQSGIPRYWFYKGYQGTPYEKWLSNMQTTDQFPVANIRSGITLVVKRNEAHNPYHTMCEFYNIFLLIKKFNWDVKTVDILLMDSRPITLMDEAWQTLFRSVRRQKDFAKNEIFENLIWIPIGYESPMNFHLVRNIPYTEEFRTFVLDSFRITPRKMNCDNLQVVLILRHDYISHPERLTLFGGKIHRKFANEPEMIWALEKAFPKHTVKAVVLEDISVKTQLELISSTDVLIGMHGAGLTHFMFVPQSAVVLELFPYSFRWRAAYYFHAMAEWRGLKHYIWTNPSKADEVDVGFSSKIPPDYLTQVAGEIKDYINNKYCHS